MINLENNEKVESIAFDIINLSRNTLLINMRFLDIALNQFILKSTEEGTISTDGKFLYYNPIHVLEIYLKERSLLTRNYLHLVFHCVFRHMYFYTLLDKEIWDLACDIAVENIINELNIKSVESSKQNKQNTIIDKLKSKMKLLNAEQLYRYYLDSGMSENEIKELKEIFRADDHSLWYFNSSSVSTREKALNNTPGKNVNSSDKSDGLETKSHRSKDLSKTSKSINKNIGANSQNSDSFEKPERLNTKSPKRKKPNKTSSSNEKISGTNFKNIEMEKIWKNISTRMQTDLETFSKTQGDTAGNLTQSLKKLNHEKYDYTSFLKKFAVMGERMQVNDDEFDYIFYTYGLSLYKNMPLIEPLEYKEVKLIKEFVIAIDTSASTSGVQVQRFIQKMYNILKSTESFFSKINIHIIQADANIQEVAKITNQDEFELYIKDFEIKGLGGTDFRPVFIHVDYLIKKQEFFNLKGLIYFTDGYGTFPAKKPNYETAFVFVDEEFNIPAVPSWAIKLILEEEDL